VPLEEFGDARDKLIQKLEESQEAFALKHQKLVETNREYMALHEKMKNLHEGSQLFRQDRDKLEQQLKELQVVHRAVLVRLEHQKPKAPQISTWGESSRVAALEESVQVLTIGLEDVQCEKEGEDLVLTLRLSMRQHQMKAALLFSLFRTYEL